MDKCWSVERVPGAAFAKPPKVDPFGAFNATMPEMQQMIEQLHNDVLEERKVAFAATTKLREAEAKLLAKASQAEVNEGQLMTHVWETKKEADILNGLFEQLSKELDGANRLNKQQEEELESMRCQLETKSDLLRAAEGDLSATRAELSEFRLQTDKLASKNSALSQEVEKEKKSAARSSNARNSLQHEMGCLQRQIDKLTTKVQRGHTENEQLRAELQNANESRAVEARGGDEQNLLKASSDDEVTRYRRKFERQMEVIKYQKFELAMYKLRSAIGDRPQQTPRVLLYQFRLNSVTDDANLIQRHMKKLRLKLCGPGSARGGAFARCARARAGHSAEGECGDSGY